MVHLPPGVISYILSYYIGFHTALALRIQKNWRIHYRRSLGRVGRARYFVEFGLASNGYTNRARLNFERAYERRTQRIGTKVRIPRGVHKDKAGTIMKTTHRMLLIKNLEAEDYFMASRETVLLFPEDPLTDRPFLIPEISLWWLPWILTGDNPQLLEAALEEIGMSRLQLCGNVRALLRMQMV